MDQHRQKNKTRQAKQMKKITYIVHQGSRRTPSDNFLSVTSPDFLLSSAKVLGGWE
jgi:hypothetical protein